MSAAAPPAATPAAPFVWSSLAAHTTSRSPRPHTLWIAAPWGTVVALCGLMGVSLARADVAADWPQWRGPSGTGIASEGEYPAEFGPAQNVAWKAVLPGLGSSTPVVWGDSIVLTCVVDDANTVCCYDFAGHLQWQRTLGPARAGKHRNGSGANPSPAVSEQGIVVYFKSGELAALNWQGDVLWSRNLQEEYGADTLWWDLGTSPILAGNKAIVAVMQEGTSYLLAVDLATGENAWKQSRQYERPPESDQAYTTPQLVDMAGTPTIVTWGADHLTGHEAATGKLLWECGGFNPENEGMWRVIASAVVADQMAVIPYGRGTFVAGVLLSDRDGAPHAEIAWNRQGVGADVPTPVVADGKIYVLSDAGPLSRLDLATGEVLDELPLPRSRSKFYASPVLAGSRLFLTREDGVVFVVEAGEQLKLVAENDLGEQALATPLPLRDALLIRTAGHLYCFRVAP